MGGRALSRWRILAPFRGSVSTAYASRSAVDADIKSGKLVIKATSPTGIVYKANCLTYFDVSNDSNLQW